MIRRCLLFTTFSCAVACSSDPEPIAIPDASVAADSGIVVHEDAMVTPIPCDARAVTASISEGGRATIMLELDQSDAVISISDVPPDWRVELLAEGPAGLWIRVPYGIDGRFTIGLDLTCGDETGTGAIDVDVRRIVARDISAPNGPDAREHSIMWIDGDDPNRMLLFGGYSFEPQQYTIVTDIWALDLPANTWSMLTPTGDVPHVAGGRLATIPGSNEVVHFGGSTQTDDVVGDVHSFDPATLTFTALSSGSMDGETLGAFIYDAPRDRYLSVCGYTGFEIHCDVRAFYPADQRWEDIPVAPGDDPTGRYGFFFAHDTETDRLIIFSGAQYPRTGQPVNPAQDTWALELSEDPPRWMQIAGGPGDPPGRRNGCAAYDPVGHRLFVLGGTPDARNTEEGLWALSLDRDAETWTRVEVDGLMPVRSSGSGVYDQARSRILFGFGNSTSAIYDDLWALEL